VARVETGRAIGNPAAFALPLHASLGTPFGVETCVTKHP